MKWSAYVAQWMTLIFGVTPPKPEDETRYAWTVIGLFATLMITLILLLVIIVPLTIGK
jgi:type IV secretory pathway component VirB8